MSSGPPQASWQTRQALPSGVFERPGNPPPQPFSSHVPQSQAYSPPPRSFTRPQRYASGYVSNQPSIGIGPQTRPQLGPTISPVVVDTNIEPWKSKGYPALSKWMASSNDFFIIRKFGKLNARVILMMQDRISYLEEKLESIDQECRTMDVGKGDNGTFRHDSRSNGRLPILEELAYRLDKYNKFILRHSELKARPKPLPYQVRNVENWFYNNQHAIFEPETQFVTKKDLMSILPRSEVPLRKLVEKFDWIKTWRIFRKKQLDEDQSNPTIYNKDARISATVTCITIGIGLAMLIVPLWLLQHATHDAASLRSRLSIISGFIVLFTAVMGIVTVARPFEVLAATAAYSAVLMVFLQVGSNNYIPSP